MMAANFQVAPQSYQLPMPTRVHWVHQRALVVVLDRDHIFICGSFSKNCFLSRRCMAVAFVGWIDPKASSRLKTQYESPVFGASEKTDQPWIMINWVALFANITRKVSWKRPNDLNASFTNSVTPTASKLSTALNASLVHMLFFYIIIAQRSVLHRFFQKHLTADKLWT